MQFHEMRRVRSHSEHVGSRPRLFNLDLHISVIADLKTELRQAGIPLTHWSLSGHNYVFRRLFRISDPVDVVNSRTWAHLDSTLIDQFQDRYGKFLRTFDGFITCYTPAFAELFQGLDKPTLVVAATRYEAPYSHDPSQWKRLNDYIRGEVDSARLMLTANNQGDRDYLQGTLGARPRLVPSVCDYTRARWSGTADMGLIHARSTLLSHHLQETLGGGWSDFSTQMPRGYKWKDLFAYKEVLVVPYNISTMTLFELATAGVPVSVPSRRLLKEWARLYDGVLSELTWFQVRNLPVPSLAPIWLDHSDPRFFDWWLDRADFYDAALMPNVRVFDSLDELRDSPHPFHQRPRAESNLLNETRNEGLRERRSALVRDFLGLC